MRNILIVVACIVLWSCSPQNSSSTVEKDFFNVEEFYEDYFETNDSVVQVTKIIESDQNVEEKKLSQYNIKKDLKLLLGCQIDKPALWDKYKVDSVLNENDKIFSKTYTALSEEEKIQEIKIEYKGGNSFSDIACLKCKTRIESRIAKSFKEYEFWVDSLFQIDNREKIIFSEEKKVLTSLKVLKK